MSEFRFFCPECGQKILGDTGYIGTQITCPTCQQTITIPAAAAAAPAMAAQAVGAGGAPPNVLTEPAAPRPQPVPAEQKVPVNQNRYSALAMASLICSVFVGLGFIPGIICGHLAKKRMKRDVFLEGEKMANAGLLISYCVGIAMVAGALMVLGTRWHFHPTRVIRDTPQATAALKTRVVDEVIAGENEEEHDLESFMSSPSQVAGRPVARVASRGGSFGYMMKVLPHEAMDLNCHFWGSERRGHVFDIAVENQIIATQELLNNLPGKFFDMEYKIPASLTRGKTQVKVEFVAHTNTTAGELFSCQILRR